MTHLLLGIAATVAYMAGHWFGYRIGRRHGYDAHRDKWLDAMERIWGEYRSAPPPQSVEEWVGGRDIKMVRPYTYSIKKPTLKLVK